MGATTGMGGMNDDIDHSESDEGNNQENPNFSGNEFIFKKRDFTHSGGMLGQDNQVSAAAKKQNHTSGKKKPK